MTKQELNFNSDLSSPPPEVMLVWHTNAKEPTVTRKSNAPIPLSQSRDPPPREPAVRFEEVPELDVMDTTHPKWWKRPKQKRNDSVSLFFRLTFY